MGEREGKREGKNLRDMGGRKRRERGKEGGRDVRERAGLQLQQLLVALKRPGRVFFDMGTAETVDNNQHKLLSLP